MIINFSFARLSIIFLLVIIFPFIQKQWLNLYLFDINNFSIYKLLYYVSGLIVPIFVVINSLNKFTYYKFNYHIKNNNKNNNNNINGKLLLLLTFIVLTTLSYLISYYIFINLKIFTSLLLSTNEYLIQFDIDKQIFFMAIISTFLIFKKTKYFIKKIILTNFFIFSIIIWYSEISSSFTIDIVPLYTIKFGNINFINIAFLMAIEIFTYLWSYISYSSYLSDWNVPKPCKNEVKSTIFILIYYLFIILYYSLVF